MTSLFQCPECRVPLVDASPWNCTQCDHAYVGDRGLLSFLEAGVGTRLDDIDYDSVYQVTAEASQHLFAQCRKFLGPDLPTTVDDYLEIGAGTGLFTSGLLGGSQVARATITDVSASMLGVCRERLGRAVPGSLQRTQFVLWDGRAGCLADERFDFVAGFSVLHHVLDYPGLLRELGRVLQNDGRAVFLEPNLAFHVALNELTAQVLACLPSDAPVDVNERASLAAWMSENHINAKYRGNDRVLADREDKHMFDRSGLEEACAPAGLTLDMIPFAEDGEVWSTLGVYLRQLPLSLPARRYLLERFARLMPGPFGLLPAEDLAPSTLLVFKRGADVRPPQTVSGRSPMPLIQLPEAMPISFRFAMDVTVGPAPAARPGSSELQIIGVAGWVLGDVDLRYVSIRQGGRSLECAVGALRLDVSDAFNGDRRYPPQRAYCCGLIGPLGQSEPVASEPVPTVGAEAEVVAIAMDGREFHLHTFKMSGPHVHFESLEGVTSLCLVAGTPSPRFFHHPE